MHDKLDRLDDAFAFDRSIDIKTFDSRAERLREELTLARRAAKPLAMPAMPGVSDDTSTAPPRRNGVLSTYRGHPRLEHHDERLTDGRLDFAIGASSGAQKAQDNYCTICCTILDTGG